jgi:hypothetical protein
MSEVEGKYLLFSKFQLMQVPIIEPGTEKCIWCDLGNSKNCAHIISRGLLKSNNKNNVLNKSVCKSCNEFFSNNIEDWLFKYTILGYLKDSIKSKRQYALDKKFLINFLYHNTLKEWLIVNNNSKLISEDPSSFLQTQILLTNKNQLKVVYFHSNIQNQDNYVKDVILRIMAIIDNSVIKKRIQREYPKNFKPRLVLDKGHVIFTSTSNKGYDEIIRLLKNKNRIAIEHFNIFSLKYSLTDFSNVSAIYRWDMAKYYVLTAKIAYEFLCLLDLEFVRKSNFKSLKKVIEHKKNIPYKKNEKTILYEEGKGFSVRSLIPNGFVAMGEYFAKKGTQLLPFFLSDPNLTHYIIIYQFQGMILANVKLFNIEPSLIIIGYSDFKMENYYCVTYNITKDELLVYKSCATKNTDLLENEILAHGLVDKNFLINFVKTLPNKDSILEQI